MRSGGRRRIVLTLLLSWPVAFAWVGWIALTGYSLVEHYRSTYVSCGGALSAVNLPGVLSGCSGVFSPALAWIELAVMIIVLVGVTMALARWMLSPVRAMAETVSRLGPTSLGLRLRAGGPHDKNRELADAIDAMLDRVAEGYEAQRRFASNASHELRTPLATQRALIEISLAETIGPQQLQHLRRLPGLGPGAARHAAATAAAGPIPPPPPRSWPRCGATRRRDRRSWANTWAASVVLAAVRRDTPPRPPQRGQEGAGNAVAGERLSLP